MIDPAQIPDEVVEAAKEAYRHTDEKTMSDWLAEIIAAALNAWPGAYEEYMNDEDGGGASVCMILPQEASDE